MSAGWYTIGGWRFNRAVRRTLIPPKGEELEALELLCPGKRPGLARCQWTDTPMLIGFFHPVIVLPDRRFTPGQLRSILLHELTHYHRGDIAYKWICAIVFCLHWFNPFTRLFRHELELVCEISCDERLLRGMDAEQKRQYGHTILDIAEVKAFPRGVIATSFAAQKRTLKERLEQIMTYKNRGKKWLLPTLMVMLALIACAASFGPASAARDAKQDTGAVSEGNTGTVTAASGENAGTVTVSTVDELLAAIAPNTTIYLEPGEYNLSTAAESGDGEYYTWGAPYGGGQFQLEIRNVENLALVGGGTENVTISVEPRDAYVLGFYDCDGITVEGITVGHTIEPGVCTGGVIYLENSSGVNVKGCALYGCGIWGVQAQSCQNVLVEDTAIYDCSNGAVSVGACYDVRVENCSIYDCECSALLQANTSYGFAVVNCEIYDNNSRNLLRSGTSREVYLLGCRISDNTIEGEEFLDPGIFYISGYDAVVEDCVFENNSGKWSVSDELHLVSADGAALDIAVLEQMTRKTAVYNGPKPIKITEVQKTVNADGMREVHVSTAEELIAAIAPDTIIYLEAEEYNLAQSENYGAYGGEYCYWRTVMDGAELVICGVKNLQIVTELESATICTEPRQADVLVFEDCETISLTGVTAGHTEAADPCGGAVLMLDGCSGMTVDGCHLYGCGRLGVDARSSRDLSITNTEIYECSGGAATVGECENVAFDNCNIHDCGQPMFSVWSSTNVTRDGEAVM